MWNLLVMLLTCLALPAAFTQPGARLLAEPCMYRVDRIIKFQSVEYNRVTKAADVLATRHALIHHGCIFFLLKSLLCTYISNISVSSLNMCVYCSTWREIWTIPILSVKAFSWIEFWIIPHPAWAAGSYRSAPRSAGLVGTKSRGGFYQQDGSPWTSPPAPFALSKISPEI